MRSAAGERGRRRVRPTTSPTAIANARDECSSPRAWTIGRLRCRAWRNCGDGRYSTVRSATAGRCVTGRWRCWREASRAVHSALLLRGWTDDVVVLTDGPADLEGDDRTRLAGRALLSTSARSPNSPRSNGELTAVVFADGSRLARSGLLVATTLHQRSTLADQLGAAAAGRPRSLRTPWRWTVSTAPPPAGCSPRVT